MFYLLTGWLVDRTLGHSKEFLKRLFQLLQPDSKAGDPVVYSALPFPLSLYYVSPSRHFSFFYRFCFLTNAGKFVPFFILNHPPLRLDYTPHHRHHSNRHQHLHPHAITPHHRQNHQHYPQPLITNSLPTPPASFFFHVWCIEEFFCLAFFFQTILMKLVIDTLRNVKKASLAFSLSLSLSFTIH